MKLLFQISAHATTYREESDIYNDNIVREITVEGVAWNIIQKPPVQQFNSSKMLLSFELAQRFNIQF